MSEDRRGTLLLALGALAGVSIAAVSLLRGEPVAPPSGDAVAWVDGRPIARDRYERALAAVAADRRGGALTDTDGERVLERLIDEELLLSRAVELGLATADPAIRNDLVRAMIDRVHAQAAEAPPPSRDELRAFYEAEPWRFRRSPRLTVEHAYFRDRAAARAAVDGAPLESDPGALPLPGGPLTIATLTQRLGPTAARAIAELDVGATGGPWRARDGWHVARLVARRPGAVPAFGSIEDQVRAEHARVRAEHALRELLDARRDEAEIVR